ncbi:MAG: TolC family protein, partial [Halopseudomonas sp.]
MHKLIPGLLSLALAGCQLAPDYQRPASPVPLAYPHTEVLDGERRFIAAALPWQSFFADPQLQVLIRQALLNNRDLQAAVYRIEETRGLSRVQNAARFPSLGLGADASRGRVNQGVASGAAGSGSAITETYSVNAAVSAFELDFWGRVGNLSAAARAEYFASIEAQQAFRLSLIRDVASTYLGLREAVERIALAEATVLSRRDGLRIAKVRLDAGITSALDFNHAEAL